MRAGLVLCLLAAALCPGPAAAAPQEPPGGASVRGIVVDAAGIPLAGAIVSIGAPGRKAAASVVSDPAGRFVLPGVVAGEHEVRADLAGFVAAVRRVRVSAGDDGSVDLLLVLKPRPLCETVTVTRAALDPSAVPAALSVIPGERIGSFQRRASPAEAFDGVPGLYVENRRNLGYSGGVRLSIRAPLPRLGMRGLQLLQDGVPMTMADGTTEPGNIDLGSLGRVEVLRGPSALLYGNSAGGVVVLRTETPAAAGLVVEPDLQSGSFGYLRQQVKAQGTRDKVGFLLDVNRFVTDGFRDHSRADARRVNLVLRYAPADVTEVRCAFNLYYLPFGENSGTLTRAEARAAPASVRPAAVAEDWGESATQGQAGLTIERKLAGGGVVRATAWGLGRDVRNSLPARVVAVARTAAGLRAEAEGPLARGGVSVRWAAGFDASMQDDDRGEFRNEGAGPVPGRARAGEILMAQRERVLSAGPFAKLSVCPGRRWTLVGGLRFDGFRFSARDHHLQDGDQSGGRRLGAASSSLGAVFKASESVDLYAAAATSYQTPTTVELSNRPTGEGGFNEELGPERQRSLEAGVRGRVGRRASFELAAYAARVSGVLVRFERPDEQEFFRNAGEASRRGIEAALEWAPSPRLELRFAYTRQDFRYRRFVLPGGDFSGKREPCAPPHQLFLAAAWTGPAGLRAFARARYVAAYPVDNANSESNWAYAVADVRLGWEREWRGLRLRPFVGVDNVFGARYNSSTVANSLAGRCYEPSPGREWTAGVTAGKAWG